MPADSQTTSPDSDPKPVRPDATPSLAGDAALHAASASGSPQPAAELTPEEQMERFEKELKETDWGHQPC